MSPAENDWVEVYSAKDGWRWRRQAANGDVVSESGEAYTRRYKAVHAAERVNADITEIKILDDEEDA